MLPSRLTGGRGALRVPLRRLKLADRFFPLALDQIQFGQFQVRRRFPLVAFKLFDLGAHVPEPAVAVTLVDLDIIGIERQRGVQRLRRLARQVQFSVGLAEQQESAGRILVERDHPFGLDRRPLKIGLGQVRLPEHHVRPQELRFPAQDVAARFDHRFRRARVGLDHPAQLRQRFRPPCPASSNASPR